MAEERPFDTTISLLRGLFEDLAEGSPRLAVCTGKKRIFLDVSGPFGRNESFALSRLLAGIEKALVKWHVGGVRTSDRRNEGGRSG